MTTLPHPLNAHEGGWAPLISRLRGLGYHVASRPDALHVGTMRWERLVAVSGTPEEPVVIVRPSIRWMSLVLVAGWPLAPTAMVLCSLLCVAPIADVSVEVSTFVAFFTVCMAIALMALPLAGVLQLVSAVGLQLHVSAEAAELARRMRG